MNHNPDLVHRLVLPSQLYTILGLSSVNDYYRLNARVNIQVIAWYFYAMKNMIRVITLLQLNRLTKVNDERVYCCHVPLASVHFC